MTRALLCLWLPVMLLGCGPDVTPWKGTWTGTLSLNTGRQPLVGTGTLVVSDGGRFAATSAAVGTPAVVYSAELFATAADAATVTFTGPTPVTLTATPSDGCTRKVTANEGSGARSGDSLTLSVSGRVESTCSGGSSVVENFLLELAATRR